MTDDEAETLQPEAERLFQEAWKDLGLGDLGVPIARILPWFGGERDPHASHALVGAIVINGHHYALQWRIEGSDVGDAAGNLARWFALPRVVAVDPETNRFIYGKSFRERVAEELAAS
jgi:hypothetical protein